MNKTRYKVRHIRCNMNDFNIDRHRFRFEYNGNEEIANCISGTTVTFDNDNLPDDVKLEVTEIIYKKMDKEESKRRYPDEAYDIVDEYIGSI